MKKQRQEKLQTRAVIDKWLARVLSLTKAERHVNFRVNVVHYNAEKKELVATNGRALIVVKIKTAGTLIPLNLEDGDYEIVNDMLLKDTREIENTFPPYKDIISVKAKEICHGDILSGIVNCMIKGKVYLDVFKYLPVLKILDGFSSSWSFVNESPVKPVMMKADDDKYNIKYIIMPMITI